MNPLSRIRRLTKKATDSFRPVEEENPFFKLWPHRFDYLYAEHPEPGKRPEWLTESRHPLTDRLIVQSSYLYGVRFSSETNYGLLDIDKGSPYHPRHDPQCLNRIFEALESLGLVEHLIVTSSASGGLHIYFPFEVTLPSWKLAIGISALLEKAGFKIMAGWLEVFPNQKPFSTDGTISLYNGHRLPMQQGSYLLNESLHPTASSEEAFTQRWQAAARRNDICGQTLTQVIKQYRRRQYRITGKADKFLNDLNAEVELGWTGRGQTNRLLGRIAMRSYIFGHVLEAPAPLAGQVLIDDIVRVATALPGYTDYCGHQHEIRKRAKDWARSVEESHYFHYGSGKAAVATDEISWNEQQRLAARDRIRDAVIELLKINHWPEGVGARIDAIQALCTVSGSTLYKNKDLWHPAHLAAALRQADPQRPLAAPVESPPHPPVSQEGARRVEALSPCPPNLLDTSGCKPMPGEDSRLNAQTDRAAVDGGGWNLAKPSALSTDSCHDAKANDAINPATGQETEGPPRQLVLDIQATLHRASQVEAILKAQRAEKYRQQRLQQAQAVHRAQLEAWLNSGDPVLEAEARQQLQQLARREDNS